MTRRYTGSTFCFSITFYVILLSTFYFLLSYARAAEISIVSNTHNVTVGQQVTVDVSLDAQGESINAVEGSIFFPVDALDFKDVLTGNSIVGLWVQNPALRTAKTDSSGSGEIYWSGTIPGGFNGLMDPRKKGLQPGKIVTVVFVAKKSGTALLKVVNAKALLNNGLGTETQVSAGSASLVIEEGAAAATSTPGITGSKDSTPPEFFTPQVARDPNVFDGKWFLVFAAEDKGSGVDHYEILETNHIVNTVEGGVSATSPHLLKDQSLKSYIYVKAIDKSGNSAVAMVLPRSAGNMMKNGYLYLIFAIIIGGIMAAYLVFRLLRKNRT